MMRHRRASLLLKLRFALAVAAALGASGSFDVLFGDQKNLRQLLDHAWLQCVARRLNRELP